MARCLGSTAPINIIIVQYPINCGLLALLMAMGTSQSRPRRSDDPLEPCPTLTDSSSLSGFPSRRRAVGNFRHAAWTSPNHARSSVLYPFGSGVVSYMLTLTPPICPEDETLEERLRR
ncbi:hypothetical protein BDW71DRAFT_89804 [Aspergillus fruticulosus]